MIFLSVSLSESLLWHGSSCVFSRSVALHVTCTGNNALDIVAAVCGQNTMYLSPYESAVCGAFCAAVLGLDLELGTVHLVEWLV